MYIIRKFGFNYFLLISKLKWKWQIDQVSREYTHTLFNNFVTVQTSAFRWNAVCLIIIEELSPHLPFPSPAA